MLVMIATKAMRCKFCRNDSSSSARASSLSVRIGKASLSFVSIVDCRMARRSRITCVDGGEVWHEAASTWRLSSAMISSRRGSASAGVCATRQSRFFRRSYSSRPWTMGSNDGLPRSGTTMAARLVCLVPSDAATALGWWPSSWAIRQEVVWQFSWQTGRLGGYRHQ